MTRGPGTEFKPTGTCMCLYWDDVKMRKTAWNKTTTRTGIDMFLSLTLMYQLILVSSFPCIVWLPLLNYNLMQEVIYLSTLFDFKQIIAKKKKNWRLSLYQQLNINIKTSLILEVCPSTCTQRMEKWPHIIIIRKQYQHT